MTTPTNPDRVPSARAPRPDALAIVLLTFDCMSDALTRRDGDTFVNCLESLRYHLGDEAVDAMIAHLIQVGQRRLTARLTNDQTNAAGGAR